MSTEKSAIALEEEHRLLHHLSGCLEEITQPTLMVMAL